MFTYYHQIGGKTVAFTTSDDSKTTWMFGDQISSTSLTRDDTGTNKVQRYTPWGETRTDGGLLTDHTYTGQIEDTTTGLSFYNARYYDPAIARFVSPDTIIPNAGNGQNYNRYAYVLNNPIRYNDPTGHESCNNYDDGCGNSSSYSLDPGRQVGTPSPGKQLAEPRTISDRADAAVAEALDSALGSVAIVGFCGGVSVGYAVTAGKDACQVTDGSSVYTLESWSGGVGSPTAAIEAGPIWSNADDINDLAGRSTCGGASASAVGGGGFKVCFQGHLGEINYDVWTVQPFVEASFDPLLSGELVTQETVVTPYRPITTVDAVVFAIVNHQTKGSGEALATAWEQMTSPNISFPEFDW